MLGYLWLLLHKHRYEILRGRTSIIDRFGVSITPHPQVWATLSPPDVLLLLFREESAGSGHPNTRCAVSVGVGVGRSTTTRQLPSPSHRQ